MAFVPISPFTSGQVLTAAQMNEIGDNLNAISPLVVSSLPGSPSIGDVVMFEASSTLGVIWQLLYDGAGSFPWKFIGGGALYGRVDTTEGTTSSPYADLATVGPTFSTPLPGDYIVSGAVGMFGSASSTSGLVSFSFGGAAANTAVDANGNALHVRDANVGDGMAFVSSVTGIGAGAITMRYRASGGTASFRNRRMQATPIRVAAP
jgi:hypothetical protein